MSPLRVVVTGPTGYIGLSLLAEIRNNHLDTITPVVLCRPTSDLVPLHRLLDHPASTPSIHTVDYANPATLAAPLRDVDVIVHLAADMDFFPSDPATLHTSNVIVTDTLLSATLAECNRATRRPEHPLRFIYVSSTEAIGPTSPNAPPASESTPHHPTSPYAVSKSHCETALLKAATQCPQSLHAVIARPTGVYGPEERFFFYELMSLACTGLTILAPSPLSGRISFTHIHDVTAALLLLITHPRAAGAYNICADNITYRTLLATITDAIRYPRPIVYLPTRVGEFLITLLAPVMNFRKRRTFIYHAKTVRETMEWRVYSNHRLCSELGFKPKYNMVDGVRQTVEYELQTGGIRPSRIPPLFHRIAQAVAVVAYSMRFLARAKQRQHDAHDADNDDSALS